MRKSLQPTLNPSSGKYPPTRRPKSLNPLWLHSFIVFLKSSFPRDFSSGSHQAGSPGDEVLGNKLVSKFKDYGMKFWTDEHFVKVQDPPLSGYNRIVFKNGNEERPTGFLSYSACGTVTVRSLLNSDLPVYSKFSPGLTRLCFFSCSRGPSSTAIMVRKVTS